MTSERQLQESKPCTEEFLCRCKTDSSRKIYWLVCPWKNWISSAFWSALCTSRRSPESLDQCSSKAWSRFCRFSGCNVEIWFCCWWLWKLVSIAEKTSKFDLRSQRHQPVLWNVEPPSMSWWWSLRWSPRSQTGSRIGRRSWWLLASRWIFCLSPESKATRVDTPKRSNLWRD